MMGIFIGDQVRKYRKKERKKDLQEQGKSSPSKFQKFCLFLFP